MIKNNKKPKFEVDYLSKCLNHLDTDVSNILNNRDSDYRIPKVTEFTKTDINNLFEVLDNQKQNLCLCSSSDK